MQDWERDQIRAANDRLRANLDTIRRNFEREIGEAGEIYRKLAAMQIHATSPKELARVTVNSSGVVIEVAISDDAYRRSTPQELAADLNAAIREAVQAANQARAKVVAPIRSIVDGAAGLGELAPNLRGPAEPLSRQPESPHETP